MNDFIGFRLPKANFKSEFVWIGIAMVGGWLLSRIFIGSASLEVIALAATLWCVSYWYMATHEWVLLSRDGIQGQSPSGAKVFIPWSASIALGSRCAFGNIKCYAIKDINQKRLLMLPIAIVKLLSL